MASTKKSQRVQLLQLPQYDAFDTIARCCHLDIYIQEKKIKMITHESPNRTSNVRLKHHVVYFLPSGPGEDYNKHGNLSYVIDWDMVIDRLGPNMYLLDQTIDSIQGYTSVLLTSNDYDDKKLEKVSLITKGSPIMRSGGKFYHASSCLCEERLGLHEVILVIESRRSADARWLFRNSNVRPNDHSLANIPFGELSKCVLYNTIRGGQCPFPLTFQQTRHMLRSVNPELTFTVGPVNALTGGGEPRIEKNTEAAKNKEEEDVEDADRATSEESTGRSQENQTKNGISDSSTTNAMKDRETFDANHLHNCVMTLTALVLVTVRFILNDELLIQLMMLALVVALRYHVLPALWPQQPGPRAGEENCASENAEGSCDELDAVENDSDESDNSNQSFS